VAITELLRVTLELERNSDPPRGRLLASGSDFPFAGWLGLAIALERAIETNQAEENALAG
jgi:hypothetical protein